MNTSFNLDRNRNFPFFTPFDQALRDLRWLALKFARKSMQVLDLATKPKVEAC